MTVLTACVSVPCSASTGDESDATIAQDVSTLKAEYQSAKVCVPNTPTKHHAQYTYYT